ncbi:MAG TPA: protein kinase [Candidatus Eisenbacteria bacterium]|nr:protein kinase [Candidatus Eisenbacteria bacterium]
MLLSPRTRLGTYEILSLLGTGGMGEVYRAKDLRLGREVAVKVLPPEVATSPDRLARFEREARTVAGLNHPNIVTLHSVEEEDGIRFLTMELVEGQSLADLIPSGGLPLPRVLELSIPLADALVAAHGRGVIHRDLKPANVMVTRDGRVKVLDFGLAKMTDAGKPDHGVTAPTLDTPISGVGQVLGTAPYMAPEQIRGESADARTDLFALGIILYELTTGRRPFSGATSADVISAILRDTPEPLTRARGDSPLELERLVSRCLEKNPRERSQSAFDVSNELHRLKRDLERATSEKGPYRVASIAVLPFVNRSASAEDEYFSEGLADELLNVLAKIRGLRVAARTSSFYFKGKDRTIAEIGSALNVATILEGTVRKAGARVRISVQLVKVSDGYHLWTETYDRTLEDIFAVQDDIAQSVVKELRTALLGEEPGSDARGQARAEVALAARGRATDPEAYRLYLLGRHLIDRYTREDTARGIEHLNAALARNPDFALAWAERARAYFNEASFGWAPVVEGSGRAREAVDRALELEPNLAEGHARRGWIQATFDWDWRGAEASFRRAMEAAPGNFAVLRGAASLAHFRGRLDEAIELFGRALEQDPLSAGTHNGLGIALLHADRDQEAEAVFRKSVELAPRGGIARSSLAVTLCRQNRGEEALVEAMREPEEAYRLHALAIVHHARGQEAESRAALDRLIEGYADSMAYQIAEAHGARNELDAASEWLDRAFVQRDGGLTVVRTTPHLRALHGSPRWAAFLEKMDLSDRTRAP